eukprot:CAMPEP_0172360872 /NCGR_PEP_ID=MMETSP1060-20121228/4812_1 /TAXON_ID=37318 /ORGANISM="Pseudo-nitzschia pungens, Strain cf. cingulata" /LENGTH=507 /DNA_ID=CAMNT_0013082969 /DNA_START=119 /DNA_END=1642 /DNA_ORIENTATION=-
MGPEMFDLASLLENTKRRIDPEAWKAIFPGLSISSMGTNNGGVTNDKDTCLAEDQSIQTKYKIRRRKLIHQGYALVDDLFDVGLVRQGVEALHKQNIPATFILLFDEAWHLACQSKRVLEKATHQKNVFNYDLLAWYIPPGSPGFSPHRDRQPDDAPSTFHPDDQQAKFVTNWIALSDATPENSCLYVIPKPYDPGYTAGDMDDVADDDEDSNENGKAADPLHRALSTKEAFQHIRCLPRKAGQSVLFTHRIIHWGSQGDADDDSDNNGNGGAASTGGVSPRIAISFVCSDPDYEAPLLANHANYFSSNGSNDTAVRFPPLHIRLLLVCAQLLIYYQRFDLEKSVIKACYDYCKQHEEELEETYRRKVYVEFVNAMKEQKRQGASSTANGAKKIDSAEAGPSAASQSAPGCQDGTEKEEYDHDDDDDDDDEDEDAMLEEMLNAEAGGYGEFEDDYDDMEQEDDEMGIGEHDDNEEDDVEEDCNLFDGRTMGEDTEPPVKKKTKTVAN